VVDAASHARRCRDLCEHARVAALGTIARNVPEHPFVTLVTVAVDRKGRALLLLSRLAEHTANLDACSHASLLLSEPDGGGADPLAMGRVTLVGSCGRVPDGDLDACRKTFLDKHPEARNYVGFADFGFFRLEPEHVRYVGGFGRMSWVDTKSYADAWE
jgi:heme oxygenase (biliverdin-IX-beta and delta-forming)